MERRNFLNQSFALPFLPETLGSKQKVNVIDEVVVEKPLPGEPHKGKVLAALQPHSDDLPLFAAGTIAKLICEGYKGFLIRTINDNHAGKGETVGEVILNNERDNMQVAKDPGAGEGIRPGQSKSSNGQYQYCGRSVQTDLPVSLLEG